MADFGSLPDLIRDVVVDGASVAMEGFTHLIPFAAGHEMIRQEKRDLTLIRMTPDIVYDMLIGAGTTARLVFSWGGNPGVGSLHRFRDAVERGFPIPLDIEEHTHAGMAARYVAGASGLPFGILRAYDGSELALHTSVVSMKSPYGNDTVTAVPALNPDVAIIHAQQADKRGNVAIWGITGVQKEAVLAATKSIVTVEEIVTELDRGRGPNLTILPHWTITGIACVPRGSHPSYALDYSVRDNAFYVGWDAVSRDRSVFQNWIEEFVLARAFDEYLMAVDDGSVLMGISREI